MSPATRRSLLQAIAGSGGLVLAGCASDDTAPETDAGRTTTSGEGRPTTSAPETARQRTTTATDAIEDPDFSGTDRWGLPFHDPGNRKGTAATLAAEELSESWRYSTGNQIRGPAVASGAVFVATETPDDPEVPVLESLDLATGERNWRRRATDLVEDAGFVGRPLAVGSAVIARMGGRYVALGASDGTEIWQSPSLPRTDTPPTVAGTTLVVPADGGCRGLSLEDGSILWESDASGSHHPAATDDLAIVEDANALRGFDAASGEERWNAEAVNDGLELIGGGFNVPTVTGDSIVAEMGRRGDGGGYEDVALYAISATDGTVQWRRAFDGDWTNRAARGDRLFATAGDRAYALDPATGDVAWEHGLEDVADGSIGDLFVAGDRLHWVSDDGVLATRSTTDGNATGTRDVTDRGPETTPIVVDGTLVLRTLANVIAMTA